MLKINEDHQKQYNNIYYQKIYHDYDHCCSKLINLMVYTWCLEAMDDSWLLLW